MVIQNFLPANLTDYITDDALFFHTRSWNSTDSAMALFVGHHGRMQAVSIHSLPSPSPLGLSFSHFFYFVSLLCCTLMNESYWPTDRPTLTHQLDSL